MEFSDRLLSGAPITQEEQIQLEEEKSQIEGLYGLSRRLTGSPLIGSVVYNVKSGLQRALSGTVGRIPFAQDFVSHVMGADNGLSTESWYRILNEANRIAYEDGTPASRFVGGAVNGAAMYLPLLAAGRFLKPYQLAGAAGLYSAADAYTNARATGVGQANAIKYAASVGMIDATIFGVAPYVAQAMMTPFAVAASQGGVGALNLSKLPTSLLRQMHNAGGSALYRNFGRIALASAAGIGESALINGTQEAMRQVLDNAYGLAEGIDWGQVAIGAGQGLFDGIPWGFVSPTASRHLSDRTESLKRRYGTPTPTVDAFLLAKGIDPDGAHAGLEEMLSDINPEYREWRDTLDAQAASLTADIIASSPEMSKAADFSNNLRIMAEDFSSGVSHPHGEAMADLMYRLGLDPSGTASAGLAYKNGLPLEIIPIEEKIREIAKAKGLTPEEYTELSDATWEEYLPIGGNGLWDDATHDEIMESSGVKKGDPEHHDIIKIKMANKFIGGTENNNSVVRAYSDMYKEMYPDDENTGYTQNDIIYVATDRFRYEKNKNGRRVSVPPTSIYKKNSDGKSIAEMVRNAIRTSKNEYGGRAKFVTDAIPYYEKDLHKLLSREGYVKDKYFDSDNTGKSGIHRGAVLWVHEDDPELSTGKRISGAEIDKRKQSSMAAESDRDPSERESQEGFHTNAVKTKTDSKHFTRVVQDLSLRATGKEGATAADIEAAIKSNNDVASFAIKKLSGLVGAGYGSDAIHPLISALGERSGHDRNNSEKMRAGVKRMHELLAKTETSKDRDDIAFAFRASEWRDIDMKAGGREFGTGLPTGKLESRVVRIPSKKNASLNVDNDTALASPFDVKQRNEADVKTGRIGGAHQYYSELYARAILGIPGDSLGAAASKFDVKRTVDRIRSGDLRGVDLYDNAKSVFGNASAISILVNNDHIFDIKNPRERWEAFKRIYDDYVAAQPEGAWRRNFGKNIYDGYVVPDADIVYVEPIYSSQKGIASREISKNLFKATAAPAKNNMSSNGRVYGFDVTDIKEGVKSLVEAMKANPDKYFVIGFDKPDATYGKNKAKRIVRLIAKAAEFAKQKNYVADSRFREYIALAKAELRPRKDLNLLPNAFAENVRVAQNTIKIYFTNFRKNEIARADMDAVVDLIIDSAWNGDFAWLKKYAPNAEMKEMKAFMADGRKGVGAKMILEPLLRGWGPQHARLLSEICELADDWREFERALKIAYRLNESMLANGIKTSLSLRKLKSAGGRVVTTRQTYGVDDSITDLQKLTVRSLTEMAREHVVVTPESVIGWMNRYHKVSMTDTNMKRIREYIEEFTVPYPKDNRNFFRKMLRFLKENKSIRLNRNDIIRLRDDITTELSLKDIDIPELKDILPIAKEWLRDNKGLELTDLENAALEKYITLPSKEDSYYGDGLFRIDEHGIVRVNEGIRDTLSDTEWSLESEGGKFTATPLWEHANAPTTAKGLNEFIKTLESADTSNLNVMYNLAKHLGVNIRVSTNAEPKYLGRIARRGDRLEITLNPKLPYGYVLGYESCSQKKYGAVKVKYSNRYGCSLDQIDVLHVKGNRHVVVLATKSPSEVIARVMAHEIGHLVGYYGPGRRGTKVLEQIFGHDLQSTHMFINEFTYEAINKGTAYSDIYKKLRASGTSARDAAKIASKKLGVISEGVLRNEAAAVSREWLPLGRANAGEILANMVGAAILDPHLVEAKAPTWHRLFMDGKIQIKGGPLAEDKMVSIPLLVNQARAEIAVAMEGTLPEFELFLKEQRDIVNARRKRLEKGAIPEGFIKEGEKDTLFNRTKAKTFAGVRRFVMDIRANLSRADAYVLALEGDYIRAKPDVKLSDLPTVAWEEYRYASAKLQQYDNDVMRQIMKRMSDAKSLSVEDLDTMATLTRIAEGDRSHIINPKFVTKEAAEKMLNELKDRLGENDYNIGKGILDWYQSHRKKIIDDIEGFGIYDKDAIKQMRRNQNYYRFTATKYADRQFQYMKAQIGNAGGIAGAFFETIYYDAMHRAAAEKQSVKNKLIDLLSEMGEGEFVDENYRDHLGNSGIMYLKGGEIKHFTAPKEYLSFIQDKPHEVGSTMAFIEAITAIPKVIWTQTPAFAFPNLVRELSGAVIRSELTPWEIVRSMVKTLPDVWADVKGSETPLTRKMHEEGLIVAHRQQRMLTPDTAQDIKDDAQRFIRRMGGHETLQDKIYDSYKAFTGISAFSELMLKYAGADAYMRRGESLSDPRVKHEIRLNIGQPDVTLGGHMKRLMNAMFMFSPANIRGIASLADATKKRPLMTGLKYLLVGAVPVLMKYAAYNGWFGKDAEDEFKSLPDYMLKNYNPIPVGRTSSGGCYWVTLPVDYSVLPFSGFLWDVLPKYNDKMPGGKMPGKGLVSASVDAAFAFMPLEDTSINPIYRAAMDFFSYVRTGNVYDAWRGQYVVPKGQVGTNEATYAYLRYVWNSFMGNMIKLDNASELFMIPPNDTDDGTIYELMGYMPAFGPAAQRIVRYTPPGGRKNNEKYAMDRLKTEDLNIRRYAIRQFITKWLHDAGTVKRGHIQAGDAAGAAAAKEAHQAALRDFRIGSEVRKAKYSEQAWYDSIRAQAGR